jgi:predicted RNA-binding protein
MNYWLILTDQESWKVIKKNRIYAFKNESSLRKISINDKLIVYLKPLQISGIFKIDSLKTSKKALFKNPDFIHYFDISPETVPKSSLNLVEGKNINPFIQEISIFKGKKKWWCVLMGKSILKLNKKDYWLFHKNLTSKW